MSEGGAYVHNLLAGRIVSRTEPGRSTPFHPAHTTAVAALINIKGGDDRFHNNIFAGNGESSSGNTRPVGKDQQAAGFGLWVYDSRELPLQTGGNVYYSAARGYFKEKNSRTVSGRDPMVKILEEGNSVFLSLNLGAELVQTPTRQITTALLGKARTSQLAYENADGSPLAVDIDYFGRPRRRANPTPGPFENPGKGERKLQVW